VHALVHEGAVCRWGGGEGARGLQSFNTCVAGFYKFKSLANNWE